MYMMAATHHTENKELHLSIYKAEKPSVRTSWPVAVVYTSDLLEVIATSSGMTKFILKVSKSCSF